MKLYPEELATVLAALRYYQFALGRDNATLKRDVMLHIVDDIATDGGDLRTLTPDQIDSLCEKINTDSMGEPRLSVPVERIPARDYPPFALPLRLHESPSWDGVLDGNGVRILEISRAAPQNPDRTALEYMVTAVNERG